MPKLRLACLLLAVVTLGGCAGRPSGPAAPGTKLTIAVVPKAVAFDFWLSVKAGAEKAAKDNGATIVWRGPSDERDVAGQIATLEDFVNSEVDAIVMAACDSKALTPIVRKARAAKIPVITIDSGVDDKTVPIIATDNIKGARIAGDTLVKLIGGKGKVGLIPFVAGAATSTMRENGFKERPHLGQLLDPDDEVPCALELLPPRAVEKVFQPVLHRSVRRRRLEDGVPAVERVIGPVVPALQFFRRQA